MRLQAGFADYVHESQRAFRAILDALAHPGRVVELVTSAAPPAPLSSATVAVALTLLDHDTPLWLDPPASTTEVLAYVRFHCAVPVVASPADARFAIVTDPLGMPPLTAFDAGSDARPEYSTTVIVQVAALRPGCGHRLTGPGIDGEARLDVAGVPDELWRALRANHAMFPRGVDLVLCAGDTLAALPRTTRVED